MQSPVTQEPNHFDRLLDKLLVEILCRLPCSKSATQCKCVCKRWSGLISDSSFISRFVALRIGGCVPCVEEGGSSSNRSIMVPVEKCMIATRADNNRENDGAGIEKKKDMQAFAIAARMSTRTKHAVDSWKGLIIYLRDPILNPKSFTLSSLPCLEVGNGTPLTVVGACNDLLLYYSYESNKYDYYISNVQTKEWIALPSPSFYYDAYIFTGFSCDPYYYCCANKGGNGNHDVIMNPACRYSVVVVPYKPEASTKISAHMISSGTSNQWRDVILSLPTSCRLYADSTGFVFGGMLHFICSQGIIGFDPYDDQSDNGGVIECRFIAWPSDIFYLGMLRIGVFDGCLHVSTFDDYRRLVVWVLRDYTPGEWSLKHNIALKEWIPSDVSLVHAFLGWVLGFHPTHSDIIYLLNGEWIISCNLSSKIVEVVANIPTSCATLYEMFHAYPVMLPSWPTPLPTLK